jgi:hypothetical protein
MEYNAVLVVVYFIVSVFNVQLGAPIIQHIPYTSLEDCKAHAQMLENQKTQIDIEWTVYSRSQCMTRQEYDAAVAEQSKQQPDTPAQ